MLEQLDDLNQMQRVLGEDSNRAHIEAGAPGNDYARRNFVRVFLAGVEGLSFVLKTIVLNTHEMVGLTLSVGEIAKLKEIKLDAVGEDIVCEKCGVRRNFLPLADNFKFAWKMYAKSSFTVAPFPCEGEGYECFRKAISIRDRLMHPKSIDDLTVTDTEMTELGLARMWYAKNAVGVMSKCFVGHQKRMKDLYPTLFEN